MLSKTDFLLYLDAPMHLWAQKKQLLDTVEPTPYDQYLMAQGIQIEDLAMEYLERIVVVRYNQPEVMCQKRLTDGHFEARSDMVVYDRESRMCDIYEIKSGTSISKTHLYDVTFQRLVAEASLRVRDVYLVHLDRDYMKHGDLDLELLFMVENVTDVVCELLDEVQASRMDALAVAAQSTPQRVTTCLKPKACKCLSFCHPDLAEYSIYEISRLNQNKIRELVGKGVRSIHDLPERYPLTKRQKRQVQAVKTGVPFINFQAIRSLMDSLLYPLYFLDYETCNPGIPMFDGYQPYQHIVFQYSLHTVSDPYTEPVHDEFLGIENSDPAPDLLANLASHIGVSGSVIVWNQSFEASRNREMAQRYPVYSDLLMGINNRLHDLMQVFRDGDYLHPNFHGSYSIKAILPVLAPEFKDAYNDLPVSKGDEAMLAWLVILFGELTAAEVEAHRTALLRYCALDSLAMVEIWKVLLHLVS